LNKAFDYYLRGWTFYLYFRGDSSAEARRMYREAIRLDPGFARAHADLAYSLLHAWLFNWDAAATMEEAQSHAEAALKIDKNDYYSNWIAAACHLYRREFDQAARSYDKALDLAHSQAIPDDIGALRVDRAEMLLLTDKGAEALREIHSVIDDKNHAPEKWYYWVLAWAHYAEGQYKESLAALGHIGRPRNAMRKNLIAAQVALGNLREARTEAATFLHEEKGHGVAYAAASREVLPTLLRVEDRLPFKNPATLQRWKGHLSQAFEGALQP
jgi:tetratricopeptide (TPR) repeat protein